MHAKAIELKMGNTCKLQIYNLYFVLIIKNIFFFIFKEYFQGSRYILSVLKHRNIHKASLMLFSILKSGNIFFFLYIANTAFILTLFYGIY